MLRYFLGILTAFLFLGSVGGLLYIFDQGDVIDLKPSVLYALSAIPGWEDLPEAYELGVKESKILKEKERVLEEKRMELEERARKLTEEEESLQTKIRRFNMEKTRFEEERQAVTASGAETGNTPGGESPQEVARVLEAMKPEAAGEALLKMSFAKGLAALAEVDPRKAGKILETLPPEKSSLYLDEMLKH